MSWFSDMINSWKAGYNQRQKEERFIKGLHAAADVLRHAPIGSDEISFSHTGHAGDIIYSIPAMLAIAGRRRINFYLELNQPVRDFTPSMRHPNGKVMLTPKSVEMFTPLILAQPHFVRCEALNGQKVDYDLTAFRQLPFDYRMGSIARWYFLTYGVSADLGKPWLFATPNTSYADAVVIARSSRYHSPGINYGFLKKYPRLVFVGVLEEYNDMKKELPSLEYAPVHDFLQLAKIIAGSRLFIGNQSFPFSLAEALKVKRVLEVYHQCPNVIVEGANGYDFCYQPQFEKIVSGLLDH
ncbi:MAG: hypothetical protein JO301_12675 [Chitinophagaceae bacterium]|nr:hypothetical protein [Chitinophagaceae bacterium]